MFKPIPEAFLASSGAQSTLLELFLELRYCHGHHVRFRRHFPHFSLLFSRLSGAKLGSGRAEYCAQMCHVSGTWHHLTCHVTYVFNLKKAGSNVVQNKKAHWPQSLKKEAATLTVTVSILQILSHGATSENRIWNKGHPSAFSVRHWLASSFLDSCKAAWKYYQSCCQQWRLVHEFRSTATGTFTAA